MGEELGTEDLWLSRFGSDSAPEYSVPALDLALDPALDLALDLALAFDLVYCSAGLYP